MKITSITGSAPFAGERHKHVSKGVKISVPLLKYTVDVEFSDDEWERYYSVSATAAGVRAQQKFTQSARREGVEQTIYCGGVFTFAVEPSSKYTTPESAGDHVLKVVKKAFANSGL